MVTAWPDDPRAPAGGVEAVSVNLVQALANLDDLEIHVVTAKQSYSSLRVERWEQVHVHRLPWAGGRVLWNAIGPGRRQMREYLETLRPAVIHTHDTYGLMVQGMTLPRVFTIHGFIYRDTLVSGSHFAHLRSRLWRRWETAGWADQPHIISISPYVRESLGGIATGAVHDIDNPVSERFFSLRRHERPGTVFSAAAVTSLKNTLSLIDAVSRLVADGCEVKLRLAGSLDHDSYSRRVRERIAHEGLNAHISLLGMIDVEKMREELAAAAVFALASLQENSPMAIEEAMAAGVPVVTSNRCGMPYLVRDGESGFLVDPTDPRDIARRLGQLLGNDELRQSMGAKGREIALDRFHPARVAARTREVYLRAIQDFRRGRI